MNNIDFKQPYNRESFVNFLNRGNGAFMPDDFREESQQIDYSANRTKSVTRLGVCPSLKLELFEVIHNSTHDARVELSKETFRMLLTRSTNNRALVVFVPQDDPSTYRLSLVSIEVSLDENKVRRSYSNPRRYSFVLGTQAKVRTPEEYLINKGKVKDWKDLKERFSVEVLTKAFYGELSDWYSWAISVVKFPGEPMTIDGIENKEAKIEHNSKNVIRLLTRLLFVWFLKQKQLIPTSFFDVQYLTDKLLKDFDPYLQTGIFDGRDVNSVYYRAILQNLFFAMLNCPIKPQSKDDTRERGFRKNNSYGQHRDVNYFMRYENMFKDPMHFLELANSTVPFLNGGLFDCLDNKSTTPAQYVDGFSDNPVASRSLFVPDYLFFDKDKGQNVDLTWFYGDDRRKKSVNVRGLINILETYNFTIEENTPYDQEVSLDPELLGKVFENLLASYNPETKTTARKQTGSFYTPREIVQYMVDESLVAHLKRTVGEELEEEYRKLIQYTDDDLDLTAEQKKAVVKSLFECKIIDPACGSGAFPMGVLQQMVHILSQLDPGNESWKEILIDQVVAETSIVYRELSSDERETAVQDINSNFNNDLNRPDYARKLYLIENCIYGVDIQPIAVQISKLRFFISLVVEQKKNIELENFGIRPLPNLEAKFVAANTLIGLDRQGSISETEEVSAEQEKLKRIRHKIFSVRQPETKRKLKEQDREVRESISTILKNTGFVDPQSANTMAAWDPYDQNASSSFFDPKWMFGVGDGFDIVIGNPPYHQLSKDLSATDNYKSYLKNRYRTSGGRLNTFIFFTHLGLDILSDNGIISYIIPNTLLTQDYYKSTRNLLLETTVIERVVSYDRLPFENAVVENIVIVCKKEKLIDYFINHYSSNLSDVVFDCSRLKSDFRKTNTLSFNFKANDLSEKICINTVLLNSLCVINQAIALKGNKTLSISKDNVNSLYYKLLDGKNINRYSIAWSGFFLNYDTKKIHSCKTKTIFQSSEKLLFRRVSSKLIFTYDNEQYFALNTLVVVNLKEGVDISIKYLLALLNSKVIDYYYSVRHKSTKTVFSEIQANSVRELPIKIIPNVGQQPFIELVDKILEIKKFDYKADTSALEAEIDKLVYSLYNLTEEEIKIIENK